MASMKRISQRWMSHNTSLRRHVPLLGITISMLLIFGPVLVSAAQSDQDEYIPGFSHEFVDDGTHKMIFKEEIPWYEQLRLLEDTKDYSIGKAFRLSPMTSVEKMRSKDIVGSYVTRKLNNPKLTWEYLGVRELDGDKLHSWISAIEFAEAKAIKIYLKINDKNGRIIVLGNDEDHTDLGVETLKNHMPLPPITDTGDTIAGAYRGSLMYILYYSMDKERNPNHDPPFVITGIRAYIQQNDRSSINNSAQIATCSKQACGQGYDLQAHSVVMLLYEHKYDRTAPDENCTGTFISNNKDWTPYLLTAEHCNYDLTQYRLSLIWHDDNCQSGLAPIEDARLMPIYFSGSLFGADISLFKMVETIPPYQKTTKSFFLSYSGIFWGAVPFRTDSGMVDGTSYEYNTTKGLQLSVETLTHPNGQSKEYAGGIKDKVISEWTIGYDSNMYHQIYITGNTGYLAEGSSGGPLYVNKIVGANNNPLVAGVLSRLGYLSNWWMPLRKFCFDDKAGPAYYGAISFVAQELVGHLSPYGPDDFYDSGKGNDTRATATPIELVNNNWIVLDSAEKCPNQSNVINKCPLILKKKDKVSNDYDWYSFKIPPGAKILFDIEHDYRRGEFNVELYEDNDSSFIPTTFSRYRDAYNMDNHSINSGYTLEYVNNTCKEKILYMSLSLAGMPHQYYKHYGPGLWNEYYLHAFLSENAVPIQPISIMATNGGWKDETNNSIHCKSVKVTSKICPNSLGDKHEIYRLREAYINEPTISDTPISIIEPNMIQIDKNGDPYVTLIDPYPYPNEYNHYWIRSTREINDPDLGIIKLKSKFTGPADGSICNYKSNIKHLYLRPQGGITAIPVDTQIGCLWGASSDSTWISAGDQESIGSGFVLFKYDPILDEGARTATLSVADQPVTVTQSSPSPVSIFPTVDIIGAAAYTGKIAVTTTGGEAWQAQTTADWIALSSSSGSGNGSASFTVAENGTGAIRSAVITINGLTYTIVQQAGPCSVTLGSSGRIAAKDMSTGSLTVTAPAECMWTAMSDSSWLTVDAITSAVPNGLLQKGSGYKNDQLFV